jgi:hypothetical protein
VSAVYGVPGLLEGLNLEADLAGEPRAPLAAATRVAQEEIGAELARVVAV